MGVWRARVKGLLAWVFVFLRPALVPASLRWAAVRGSRWPSPDAPDQPLNAFEAWCQRSRVRRVPSTRHTHGRRASLAANASRIAGAWSRTRRSPRWRSVETVPERLRSGGPQRVGDQASGGSAAGVRPGRLARRCRSSGFHEAAWSRRRPARSFATGSGGRRMTMQRRPTTRLMEPLHVCRRERGPVDIAVFVTDDESHSLVRPRGDRLHRHDAVSFAAGTHHGPSGTSRIRSRCVCRAPMASAGPEDIRADARGAGCITAIDPGRLKWKSDLCHIYLSRTTGSSAICTQSRSSVPTGRWTGSAIPVSIRRACSRPFSTTGAAAGFRSHPADLMSATSNSTGRRRTFSLRAFYQRAA